ncbi:WbqC family protein [Marinomonas sp. GJ51-6]|uniref:WbqC family protein n=1 Tax=Marinomonas sp. GJ51-6 TaxID=2992802 RepID=UPI002934F322|nr:WbqC family protein [Marinomonas sp. GJ51-6]WOD06183.1 WbqC family protein [Marinomonas sp. GJ51-6]
MSPQTLSVMQPYFFPYLGYFQLIHKSQLFLLYDLVDFQKRSYMTRNFIVDRSSQVHSIHIPVEKSAIGTKICDVTIAENWSGEYMCRKIRTVYSRSLYFEEVYPCLERILLNRTLSLSDFNVFGIKQICDLLSISTQVMTSSEIVKNAEQLESRLCQTTSAPVYCERILFLCDLLKVDTYINPEGGQGLYQKEYFGNKGVKLLFNFADLTRHRNGENTFKYASIIDVLMINGIEETKKILSMSTLGEAEN